MSEGKYQVLKTVTKTTRGFNMDILLFLLTQYHNQRGFPI